MSLLQTPLSSSDPVLRVQGPVRAMQLGEWIIAVALTAIGAIRAIADGTSAPAVLLVATLFLAGNFAGAFLGARHASARVGVYWLLGLTALWVAAVAVSPEFVWLAFLLWLLAGHLLPLRWGLAYSVVVLALVVGAPAAHHGSVDYADTIGPLVGGVFAFGISRGYLQLVREVEERERLVASLTRAQQEAAELHDELASAQRVSGAIEERTRISRDIHDTIAQALSSIRLITLAQLQRTIDPEAKQTLEQVEALASASLADVRRIVAALVPAELESDPLPAALHRLLERLHNETGLQTQLHVDPTIAPLTTAGEVALLRVAQSALANVRQHAAASYVVISLIDADDMVRLDVIDDGRGFDAAEWNQIPGSDSSSYGLRFMRARLRELGGGLDVESNPGEGTAISAHLPARANLQDRP